MKVNKRTEIKLIVMLILFFNKKGETVTVSPLCPTNKIAPHRRIASWDDDTPQPKTLGAYLDLLTPNGPQYPGALSEDPQEDGPDDCGDIEDYDENDLSSLYTRQRRQDGYRFFFGGNNHQNERPQQAPPRPPPQAPSRPQQRPPRPPLNLGSPNRPFRPQQPIHPPPRPPYASGGYFSENPYRPPSDQYPSNDVKPVYEDNYESQNDVPYRPGVVGGPIGHIIGVNPTRPNRRPESYNTTPRPPNQVNYPMAPNQNYAYPSRPERPRNLNYSNSILGSFLDLLF